MIGVQRETLYKNRKAFLFYNIMKLIILESPYAGDVEKNTEYARKCMRDAILNHNEAPMVSHLLYTQCLDDLNPIERQIGIDAGLSFKSVINKTVVYTDLGISKGMKYGIDDAIKNGREVEYRKLCK